MDVCVRLFCVMPSFLQAAALQRADPPSEESYRLYKRSINWKSGQGPTKGCRAIDGWIGIAIRCFVEILDFEILLNVWGFEVYWYSFVFQWVDTKWHTSHLEWEPCMIIQLRWPANQSCARVIMT
jgi:hypothetical protein